MDHSQQTQLETYCPGGIYCDCSAGKRRCGFQKLLESKYGVSVYQHAVQEVKDKWGSKLTSSAAIPRYSIFEDSNKAQTDDNVIIIIHNTKDKDIHSADFLPEFDVNKVSCPRCRHIMLRARKLLETIPVLRKNDIKCVCGLCDLEQRARMPCHVCQNAIKKFKADVFDDARRKTSLKNQLLSFLDAKHLMRRDAVDEGKRHLKSYSDIDIVKIIERKDKYGVRTVRPRSGVDTTMPYVTDKRIANIIDTTMQLVTDKDITHKLQENIAGKSVKVTIQLDIKSDTPKRVSSVKKLYEDEDFVLKKKYTITPILKRTFIAPEPQRVTSDHLMKKSPYLSGDRTRHFKSETVLGLGTTGIMRRYHSEVSITSLSKIREELLKRNFKYFFPHPIKKEDEILRTSAELIKDIQDRLQAQTEEKLRKQEEVRKRKIEHEREEDIARDLKRKIKLAKEKGINLSDMEIDIKTGKITLNEKGLKKYEGKEEYVHVLREIGKEKVKKVKEDVRDKHEVPKTKSRKDEMEKGKKVVTGRSKKDATRQIKEHVTIQYKEDKTGKGKGDKLRKDYKTGKGEGDIISRDKGDRTERKRKKEEESGIKEKRTKADVIEKDKKSVKGEKRSKEKKEKVGELKGGIIEKYTGGKIITGKKEKGDKIIKEKSEKVFKEKREKTGKEKEDRTIKEKGEKIIKDKGDTDKQDKREMKKIQPVQKSGKEKEKVQKFDNEIWKAMKTTKTGEVDTSKSPVTSKDKKVLDGSKISGKDEKPETSDAVVMTEREEQPDVEHVDAVQADKERENKIPTETIQLQGKDQEKVDKKMMSILKSGGDHKKDKGKSIPSKKEKKSGAVSDDDSKSKIVTKGEVDLLNKVIQKQDKVKMASLKLKNAQEEKLLKSKQTAKNLEKQLHGEKSAEFLNVRDKKEQQQQQQKGKDEVTQTDKKEMKKELKIDMKNIAMQVSGDDLILKMVKMRTQKEEKPKALPSLPPLPATQRKIRPKQPPISKLSEMELDAESLLRKKMEIPEQKEIVVETSVTLLENFHPKPQRKEHPIIFKAVFKGGDEIERKIEHMVKPEVPDDTDGAFRYALSDRRFIENGWTMLPTEKIVRKMNVFQMHPAQPEFDWYKHNKDKNMQYENGAKLAEFDDNGRGRWYYKNGRLALDYYDSEDMNAQQRYVIYSSGEPDERGRSRPITVLGMFDYNGNGVVFDHAGKIRLKYNQNEGVILDRSVGPVSHWKWHSLNDPPILQQVMIDTQLNYKDPGIYSLEDTHEQNKRPDDEEMVAIEVENYLKSRKVRKEKYTPFQINMKCMKIRVFL